jgi:hypothetical protein
MMIAVDPNELVATSETLRICSIEAAEIGTQLWACAQCPMPGDVQGLIDQLVVAVDRALDSVAAQLLNRAIDLTNRAVIALTDSQASTMVVSTNATPGSVGSAESMPAGTISIGGFSAYEGMTITSGGITTDVSPRDALYGGTMSIGGPDPFGEMTIRSPDGTPIADSTLLGTISVGALDYRGTPMEAVIMFAELGDQHRQNAQNIINSIVSDPNSSADEIAIGSNAQTSLDNSLGHIIAPSRRDLEDQAGHTLTDSEIRDRSARTLLDPVNIFDIH